MANAEPDLEAPEVEALWKESRAVAWSRIQTAYGPEVATLGGAYAALKDHPYLSLGALVLGSLPLTLLYLLMTRDVQHGHVFKAFLKKRHKMFDFGPYKCGIETFSLVPWVPLLLIFANIGFVILWLCERNVR